MTMARSRTLRGEGRVDSPPARPSPRSARTLLPPVRPARGGRYLETLSDRPHHHADGSPSRRAAGDAPTLPAPGDPGRTAEGAPVWAGVPARGGRRRGLRADLYRTNRATAGPEGRLPAGTPDPSGIGSGVTCSICRGPCKATEAKAIMAAVPIATPRMLWNRQLEQTCPTCGPEEPAGWTGSQCHQQTLPEDWHKAVAAAGRTTRGLEEFRRSRHATKGQNRPDLTPGLRTDPDRHVEDSGT